MTDPTITYRLGSDIDPTAVARLRERTEFPAISHEKIAAQISGARWVVTAWSADRLVGFARAISDGVTNGYISSVMVDPDHQRRGVGRAMIRLLMDGHDGVRFVLHTREEARTFYQGLGFVDAPDIMWRDRV